MAKAKIQSSTGGLNTDALPESPFFRNKDRVEADRPVRHIGGKVVPDELYAMIPYENTDEGIAERLARPHAHASVTRDELSKRIERFGDSRLAMEPWEDANPMQQIIDEHLPEGHRPKFLSERVIRRQGKRGWQPVVGSNGDPVKLGELIFASMPEQKAAHRNKSYQAKGQAQIEQIHSEFQEKQEREFRDAGMRPEALRAQRDGLDSGLHSTRGEFTA